MKASFLSVFFLSLSACTAIQIEPGASRIIASPNPAPASCKYLGQVFGHQGNAFTGGFTSNRNLEVGAMNDLKNQASRLHANYIQIITSRAGVTGSYSSNSNGYGSGSSEQTNITNVGNAYLCPSESIGLSASS